jgi:innexin
VTLCDFSIREVGNPNKSHQYTVQCALPVNLFNQQIFTLIWIWYIIVLFWNIGEAIVWSQRCVSIKAQKWITQRVFLKNRNCAGSKRLQNFLSFYLESDGLKKMN